MPRNTGYGFLVALALSLSFIGIVLVLPLAVYGLNVQWSFSWRKPFIGSFLALICLSGIFAVFFPEKCSKTFHMRRIGKMSAHKVENAKSHQLSMHFKGHHPDCGNFGNHLLNLNKRVLCAACTGLFIGALIVLAGTGLYFLSNGIFRTFWVVSCFSGSGWGCFRLFPIQVYGVCSLSLECLFCGCLLPYTRRG